MTLLIYDVNGFVGDLATIHGYAAFVDWAEDHAGPLVKQFVNDGSILKSDAFLKELSELKAPPDLMPVAMNILDNAEKCDTIVIVSMGIEP